jgi:site-specific DNA-cytosine methylase
MSKVAARGPRAVKPSPPRIEWPADAVERRPLSELFPYARNARTHSDAQVAQIAASIREWGWTIPVEFVIVGKRTDAAPSDAEVSPTAYFSGGKGTYADQWARCGNAVPPVMMRAIAEAVRDRVLILLDRRAAA